MTKTNAQKLLTELENRYCAQKGAKFVTEKKNSTGVFLLDCLLSGGISEGLGGHRLEFYGAESSCKTTFALHVIKSYQEMGKICVYIDSECSYDPEWAEIIGVNNEELIVINPTSLEELGTLFEELIPKVDLIIVDSIVSFIPEKLIDTEIDQKNIGLEARINSAISKKILRKISDRKTSIIFINQLRDNISSYGSPTTTSGGRALKHLYHTRVEFKAGEHISKGQGEKEERLGRVINIRVTKNKKGIPHKKGVCDFYYTGKIDNTKTIFWQAVKNNIIQLSGKSYSFDKTKIVGKDNFIKQFKDWDKVKEKLMEVLK